MYKCVSQIQFKCLKNITAYSLMRFNPFKQGSAKSSVKGQIETI